MIAVFAVAWWILVNVEQHDCSVKPEAFGPYPSEEMCKVAGHAIDPNDERFLTAEQKAALQKKRAEDHYAVEHGTCKDGIVRYQGKAVGLCPGSEKDGITLGGAMSWCGSARSVLTGCMKDDRN